MKSNIKISVIIPIYNCEKYLAQCIESIQNQTCNDIEILCINDCSVDRSIHLLEQFAQRDDRIRIINNKTNRGAGFSRNIGIKNARGKYIAFVDADDYCKLTMLEDAYNCCEKYNLDLLLCNYYNWDETEKKEKIIQLNWTVKRTLKEVFSWQDVKYHIFESWLWVPWNRMYRKDFLLDNQLLFSEIENSEDIYFNSLAMVLAKRIHMMDKAYYYYRMNIPNQLSRNLDGNSLCTLNELKKLKSMLQQKGIFNEVKKSYYNLAIISLHHSLVNLKEQSQKVLYEYYREKGFEQLTLPLDKPDVFYERGRYNNLAYVWKEPYGGKDRFIQSYSDFEYYQLYKDKIEDFFEKLNVRGKVAVWGAGRRGIALEKVLDNSAEKILYYLDTDSKKQGHKIGNIPIYCDEEKISDIEMIVILNRQFWDDILEAIEQAVHTCIRVYDLESYLVMGCENIDMCMQEIIKVSCHEKKDRYHNLVQQ